LVGIDRFYTVYSNGFLAFAFDIKHFGVSFL